MILHFALTLALTASADPPSEKPLALKTLHTFASAGVIDPGFTLIATPTRSAVNLWSLETGRQVGRIELPDIENRHEKDQHEVVVHSVRPDLKAILVSVRHLYYNTKLVYDKTPYFTRSVQRLYLASMEDEKKLKLLRTFEGPCYYRDLGLRNYVCTNIKYAHIPSDRPEIIASGQLYPGDRETVLDLVYDLAGKKLFENKFLDADWDRSKKTYMSASPESFFHIWGDAQSCSVMRGDKRISFLEECVKGDGPELSPDKKLAVGLWGHVYKTWDAESGALTARLDPKVPEGWMTGYSPFGVWSRSTDGRVAAVLLRKVGTKTGRIEIWNTASGKRTAAGSGPDVENIQSIILSPDGRRVLYTKNIYKADGNLDSVVTAVADLGLEDGPATIPVAPAAAKINVDKLPPGTAKLDPDAYAIVIGVEKYRQAGVPAVDYASRDAKSMAAYLGNMGFDPKNVAVLINAQAGKVDFDKHFGSWLKNRVGPKSRVFVYYAGHGAPNPTTGAGYLMPYEADPSYLEETAYPVARLYAELAKLPTKDVTVVLDACFSGQGERSLIAKGTRPLVAVQKTSAPEHAAVIAAASGSQISASDHEARHGLLTYHLLAGLHGDADENKDGKITTAEWFAYAQPAVERAAKLQNVEQTPTVSGAAGAAGERVWLTLKKP